jgi:hypothetical protein
MQKVMQWLNESISGVAVILLIITAGGVFKQVLIDSGTADYITSFSTQWNIHPLLFAWLITALLRVAIGSATVAGITAAGIVSPLLATGTVSPELLVLAVGTGSVFGSHVNDGNADLYFGIGGSDGVECSYIENCAKIYTLFVIILERLPIRANFFVNKLLFFISFLVLNLSIPYLPFKLWSPGLVIRSNLFLQRSIGEK